MNTQDLKTQLEKYAYQISTPFCYGCYKDAPTGKCCNCGSDDLMLKLENSGVEYGTSWIIEEILSENIDIIDQDEIFEQMIYDCYGDEIQVGFMTLDTVTVMKESDPTYWRIAKQEYIDSLLEDEQVFTPDNGNNYYWTYEIESFLNRNLESLSA